MNITKLINKTNTIGHFSEQQFLFQLNILTKFKKSQFTIIGYWKWQQAFDGPLDNFNHLDENRH